MRSLLLVLVLSAFVSGAHAVDPPPPVMEPPPPVQVIKNGILLVQYGGINTLKPQGRKDPPKEFQISREEVLGVRLDPTDATTFILLGKSPGTSTLTIVYRDKTRETYEVVVQPPRTDVAKRVQPGFVAFTLGLPLENAVGGFLGLNDYVVVYFTKSADPEKKTTVLMKNIRVLNSPTGTEARASIVLEVTTEEAKLLRSATESGTLALGLVAEADTKDEKALQNRKGDTPSPTKKD